QINGRTFSQVSQRRPEERLFGNIRGEGIRLYIHGCQAHAVDGDRIAVVRPGHRVRFDHDARIFAALFNRAYATEFFDDASEHGTLKVSEARASARAS